MAAAFHECINKTQDSKFRRLLKVLSFVFVVPFKGRGHECYNKWLFKREKEEVFFRWYAYDVDITCNVVFSHFVYARDLFGNEIAGKKLSILDL